MKILTLGTQNRASGSPCITIAQQKTNDPKQHAADSLTIISKLYTAIVKNISYAELEFNKQHCVIKI